MLDKNLRKEVKTMTAGIFILAVIMVLIFILIQHKFDITVIFGAMLGSVVSALNYLFLAISVENSVTKSKRGASGYMGTSYFLRMIMIGATIIFGIKMPYFNYIAVAIPFVFPRIVIMIINLYNEKKGKKGEKNIERTGDSL